MEAGVITIPKHYAAQQSNWSRYASRCVVRKDQEALVPMHWK